MAQAAPRESTLKKRQRPVLLIDADVLRYYMAFKNTKSIDWDGDGETMEV